LNALRANSILIRSSSSFLHFSLAHIIVLAFKVAKFFAKTSLGEEISS